MENKINICLLLSDSQEPPPVEEMLALEGICEKTGEVYFATTRNIGAVSKGGEVSFYADGEENISVLATAQFLRFIPNEDPESKSIRAQHELYRLKSPKRMRGFVHLEGFKLAHSGMRLDYLNGWLANGEALKLADITSDCPGPANLC